MYPQGYSSDLHASNPRTFRQVKRVVPDKAIHLPVTASQISKLRHYLQNPHMNIE